MKFIAIDIETTPIGKMQPEFLFAGAFDGSRYYFFDSASALNEFMWSQTEHTTFLFHNISFDVYIAIERYKPANVHVDVTNVYGEKPRFAFFVKEQKRWTADNKRKTERIYFYFVDTMNFFNSSLKKLMPIFYPAGVEAKSTGKFDKARNEADCRCTWLIYDSIRQTVGYNTLIRRKREYPILSASQLAFHDLIHRTGYTWARNKANQIINRPDWLKKIEKEAYHGGMVFVNPDYKNRETYVNAYDVNSEYPSVMRNLKVPVDFAFSSSDGIFDSSAAKDFIRRCANDDHHVTLLRISATTIDFCLPCRYPILELKTDGTWQETGQSRLEAKIGPVHGWYCENELVACLDKLEQLVIHQIIVYKAKKGLFAPFVDFWYQKKQTAQSEAEKAFAKLILNSAYGKFAQRKRQREILTEIDVDDETEPVRRLRKLTLDFTTNKSAINVYQREFDQFFVNKILNESLDHAITIIAALITAGGRALIMNTIPIATVAYIDTDSLYTTIELPPTLVSPSALGKFKFEGSGVITPFAKKYYLWYDSAKNKRIRKCKGVPASAEEIAPHKYRFVKTTTVRESSLLKTIVAPAFTERYVIKDLNAGLQRKTGTTPVSD